MEFKEWYRLFVDENGCSPTIEEAYNSRSQEKSLSEAKEIIRNLLNLKSTVSSANDVKNRFAVREMAEAFINRDND